MVVREAADEEIVEEHVPPPPPPRIWPWLLLLLLLVLAGAGAYWYLTREEAKTTMPNVVGLREDEARARLAEAQLEADVDRRPSRRARGVVFAQNPGAGKQLDEGQRVEILVSSAVIRVVVPSVTDLPEAEARTRLEAANFEVRARRVFAGAPEGRVIQQTPRAGERAARGSTVEMLVSKGRNLNRVPDVIGMTEEEAARALRRLEFEVRIFDVPAPDPRGTVVAQVPRGGVLAPPDARVRINVSSGEQTGTPRERQPTTPGETTPTETTPTETTAGAVRVPNVVGRSQTSALGRLRNLGLNGIVTFVRSPQPRGRVIRQAPAAGASVDRGSDVRLVVSAGPAAARVTVPDVVAQDQPTATQTLEDAGFIVDVIRVVVEDPAEEGIVIDQQPVGGTRAPRGAVVTIFVGAAG